MDSFYGGKQGVSFVIKKSFKSIDEMVADFKNNNKEDTVWFGEYCLIDTVNKNDKDNGKIFRRGIGSSTSAALGGAEFIGQIVGPSSGTPLFQFGTLDNVINHNGENYDPVAGDIRVYPTQIDENGNATQYNYRKDKNGQYKDQDIEIKNDGSFIHTNNITTSFSTVENSGLIPGMEYVHNEDGSETKTFHDSIKWTWCNIRKANENSDSWFYVGFQIPYLVNEFKATSISPYDSGGNYVGNVYIQPGEENNDHPFYKEYTLEIPKGIKGDSLNGIKVITLSKDNQTNENEIAVNGIYEWDQFQVTNDGKTTLKDNVPKYSKKITDNDLGRQVIVYEYRVTDNTANGETYLVYVGDFNVIEKINLSQDGVLKIYYTHDGDKVDENGTSKFVKTQTDKLKWVQNIIIDESKGVIKLEYNTTDKDGKNETVELGSKLRNITKASISNDGNLVFGFNTGENIVVKDSAKPADEQGNLTNFVLRTIKDVYLNTGLDQDKRLNITYNVKKDNTDSATEAIGSPLNSIYSMVVDESNFHLLVLFDDIKHRYSPSLIDNQLPTSPHVITEQEATDYIRKGSIWVKRTAAGETTTANTGVYWWLDLGNVKDDAGVLIGLNITKTMIDNDNTVKEKTILSYLNNKYPNGLISNEHGKSLIGKIATYGDLGSDKEFYAFDYTYKETDSQGNIIYNGWYYLGKISASEEREIKMYAYSDRINNTVVNDATLMNDGGIALYYKNISASPDLLLPTYWK